MMRFGSNGGGESSGEDVDSEGRALACDLTTGDLIVVIVLKCHYANRYPLRLVCSPLM